ANIAATDGYSENLIASVAGITGGVTAAGSTGDIAPGATSSAITLGFSTATAGVVGGVTLAYQSDGTGIDGLGQIGDGQQTVSVTVNNYAAPVIEKVSGAGTFSGNPTSGYTLDLGPVLQGSAPLTVGLSALNAATGLADLLKGNFAIAGSDAFLNNHFDA